MQLEIKMFTETDTLLHICEESRNIQYNFFCKYLHSLFLVEISADINIPGSRNICSGPMHQRTRNTCKYKIEFFFSWQIIAIINIPGSRNIC